jgi:hypothetical protein
MTNIHENTGGSCCGLLHKKKANKQSTIIYNAFLLLYSFAGGETEV